ncbi:MAG: histidine phosphatase family protein, partial [Rhodococcus sp.]|nr:histidine phosphatase family protein [Rhodococcus sp. (in: high G+C Gram-positive bacteria)]
VVSHGAAIRLVAAALTGVDGTFAADNHLDNTQTIELLPLPDGGWACAKWGTFLPPFEGKGSDKADNPIS